MEPSGHHVLITGGSRGIGLALARKFHALGNTILIVARDADRLRDLREDEPEFKTFAADLAAPGAVEDVAAFVEREFPKLNVLVNNAGIQAMGDFADEIDAKTIADEIQINVTAPVLLTKRLLPVLRANPSPAVVNVSSGLAIWPKKSSPVYCATKAFLHSFSLGLGYQLAEKGVKVFEILPPVVQTDMTEGRNEGEMTPDALAEAFFGAWKRDRTEVPIGKTKLLYAINRLSPGIAKGIMRRY